MRIEIAEEGLVGLDGTAEFLRKEGSIKEVKHN